MHTLNDIIVRYTIYMTVLLEKIHDLKTKLKLPNANKPINFNPNCEKKF